MFGVTPVWDKGAKRRAIRNSTTIRPVSDIEGKESKRKTETIDDMAKEQYRQSEVEEVAVGGKKREELPEKPFLLRFGKRMSVSVRLLPLTSAGPLYTRGRN